MYVSALIACAVKESILKNRRGKRGLFKGTYYITKYAITPINGYAVAHKLRVYLSAAFHCFLLPIIIATNGAVVSAAICIRYEAVQMRMTMHNWTWIRERKKPATRRFSFASYREVTSTRRDRRAKWINGN